LIFARTGRSIAVRGMMSAGYGATLTNAVTSNLIVFTVGTLLGLAALAVWLVLRLRPAKGTKGRRW